MICSYCKSKPAMKTVLDVFFNHACRSCAKVSFLLNQKPIPRTRKCN